MHTGGLWLCACAQIHKDTCAALCCKHWHHYYYCCRSSASAFPLLLPAQQSYRSPTVKGRLHCQPPFDALCGRSHLSWYPPAHNRWWAEIVCDDTGTRHRFTTTHLHQSACILKHLSSQLPCCPHSLNALHVGHVAVSWKGCSC